MSANSEAVKSPSGSTLASPTSHPKKASSVSVTALDEDGNEEELLPLRIDEKLRHFAGVSLILVSLSLGIFLMGYLLSAQIYFKRRIHRNYWPNESMRFLDDPPQFTYVFLCIFFGSVFFAHFSDQYGSQRSLLVSMICISVGSCVISAIPSYHSSSWLSSGYASWAPNFCYFLASCLMGMRLCSLITHLIASLLRRFGMGNEMVTCLCFLSNLVANPQTTPYPILYDNRRFWICFVSLCMLLGGIGSGSVVYHVLHAVSDSVSFAIWRLSYLIACILSALGFFIRWFGLGEDPEFVKVVDARLQVQERIKRQQSSVDSTKPRRLSYEMEMSQRKKYQMAGFGLEYHSSDDDDDADLMTEEMNLIRENSDLQSAGATSLTGGGGTLSDSWDGSLLNRQKFPLRYVLDHYLSEVGIIIAAFSFPTASFKIVLQWFPKYRDRDNRDHGFEDSVNIFVVGFMFVVIFIFGIYLDRMIISDGQSDEDDPLNRGGFASDSDELSRSNVVAIAAPAPNYFDEYGSGNNRGIEESYSSSAQYDAIDEQSSLQNSGSQILLTQVEEADPDGSDTGALLGESSDPSDHTGLWWYRKWKWNRLSKGVTFLELLDWVYFAALLTCMLIVNGTCLLYGLESRWWIGTCQCIMGIFLVSLPYCIVIVLILDWVTDYTVRITVFSLGYFVSFFLFDSLSYILAAWFYGDYSDGGGLKRYSVLLVSIYLAMLILISRTACLYCLAHPFESAPIEMVFKIGGVGSRSVGAHTP